MQVSAHGSMCEQLGFSTALCALSPGFRQVPPSSQTPSGLTGALSSLEENEAESRQGFLLVGAELKESVVESLPRPDLRPIVQIVFLCFCSCWRFLSEGCMEQGRS